MNNHNFKTAFFLTGLVFCSGGAFASGHESAETQVDHQVFSSQEDEGLYPTSGCPKSIDGDAVKIGENIEKLLKKKQYGWAIDLAAQCAVFGSNIDRSLIYEVINTVEPVVKKRMSLDDKKSYKRLTSQCQKRIDESGEGGSLAGSMVAHCHLKVLDGFRSALVKLE